MNSSNGREALERFLHTDPADAGCEQTIELLHAYAELIVAGDNPEIRYPGLAAHLRSCLPCADDLDGLLAVVRATDDEH
ncbi:MAG TPA: hypothetical protein VH395_09910 [Jatrophihabitantaceae bacterium]|jgi:hypothetical protein